MGSKAVYKLTLGGSFERVRLFLDYRKCGAFGCTTLNSADHCCGTDISFQLKFVMKCSPGESALDQIEIADCQIDPMFIKQRLLGGLLQFDAVDIAPRIAGIVQERINEFMSGMHITWG